ncbi:hypothetical protein G6F35_016327 [Rhizopus arrhizus]|nr:hypothetical protein G6F35_016327 [Rhizopus arrhizus]
MAEGARPAAGRDCRSAGQLPHRRAARQPAGRPPGGVRSLSAGRHRPRAERAGTHAADHGQPLYALAHFDRRPAGLTGFFHFFSQEDCHFSDLAAHTQISLCATYRRASCAFCLFPMS